MALPHSTRPGRKPRGRHPQHRLTAVAVRTLYTPGRYCDGNGLYLLVDDAGLQRWLLRTWVAGKPREIGLGSARLVPLADARREAARLRAIARAGGDPLVARRLAKPAAVPTFRAAATTVHAAHSQAFRNPKHAAQWLESLAAIAFPVFGDRPLHTITAGDILQALSPIWTTTPETARRVLQRIRVVFDWAKAKGYRDGDNPVDGVSAALPKVRRAARHHPALPYPQVPAFLEQLRAADAIESARLAFEFLILTATRTNEVLLARWDEIDRDACTWTIPASRMKALREHVVPLSARCVEILERAEAIAGDSPYVFPGRRAQRPLSNMTLLMLLRRLERRDITAHGFRSAFRDWAAERTTFPRLVVETALAHGVRDRTEAAYLRTRLLEQRRDLMTTWAVFATSPSADVVPIRA
jgi:integrase